MATINVPVGGGTFTANSGDIFNVAPGATGPITINGAADFTVNIDSSLTGTGATNGRVLTFGANTEPTVNIAAGVDSSPYQINADGASLAVNIGDGANVGTINADSVNGATGSFDLTVADNVTVNGLIDGPNATSPTNFNIGSNFTVTSNVNGSSGADNTLTFGDNLDIGGRLTASGSGDTVLVVGNTSSIGNSLDLRGSGDRTATFEDDATITGNLDVRASGTHSVTFGDRALVTSDINFAGGVSSDFLAGSDLSVNGNFVGTSGTDAYRIGDQWTIGGNIDLIGGDDQLVLGAPPSGGGPGISTIVTGSTGTDGLTVTAPVGEEAAFASAASSAGWTDNGDGTFSANGGTLDHGGVRYQSFETAATVPDGKVDGTAGDDDIVFGYFDADGDTVDSTPDTVFAYGGNDTLNSGAGDDTLFGGDGNDTFLPGPGADSIGGGAGDDLVWLSDSDSVDGGAGFDTFDATFGAFGETVTFTSATDGGTDNGTTFTNMEGFVSGDGADTYDASLATSDLNIETGSDDDSVIGGSGNDTIDGGLRSDTLAGGNGADTINGGEGDDTIDGGLGNDSIFGGAGSDTILLNDGYQSDTIFGGEDGGNLDIDTLDASGVTADGVDVFLTGSEQGSVTSSEGVATFSQIESFVLTDQADTFDADNRSGDMTVDGGAGNDSITGGTSDNTLYGGTGDDVFTVGIGDDEIFGGDGSDTIIAEDAITLTFDGDGEGFFADNGDGDSGTFQEIEVIQGSAGDDTLSASSDSSGVTLFGNGGDDQITGGSGDDSLSGGAGNDTLTGGSGPDVFIADGTADTITDFDTTTGIDGGANTDNDHVDLTSFYNAGTLATFNGLGGATYTTALGWLRADQADGVLAGAGDLRIEDGGSAVAASELNAENTGVVCFTSGTAIRTPLGDVLIDDLCIGDLVSTMDNGAKRIRWIGRSHFGPQTLRSNPKLRPVLIPKGVMGAERDLLVSRQHALLLNRDQLVRAIHLVDINGLPVRVANGKRNVTYIHLMFDDHEVIFAENVPSESFYPGPMALAMMDRAERAEMMLIFPDIAGNGPQCDATSAYGPTARHILKRKDIPIKSAQISHVESTRLTHT